MYSYYRVVSGQKAYRRYVEKGDPSAYAEFLAGYDEEFDMIPKSVEVNNPYLLETTTSQYRMNTIIGYEKRLPDYMGW